MEVNEDIVIVGAGIAGLATCLGLHRLGIRSIVLEGSESLRTTGFALTVWTNAWRALDALGIGESLRQQHNQLFGLLATSIISGAKSSEVSFKAKGKNGEHDVRCVVRKSLLEALSNELPNNAIRFLSKVVCIEESGSFKLVHLADGTIFKTKVLIGCDGVNSKVAKWLGLKMARFTSRHSIRGFSFFKDDHGFGPKFRQFFGDGVRCGFIPCDAKCVYWFFTWIPSSDQEKGMGENPAELKRFVLSKLGKLPDQVKAVLENTTLDNILECTLRYRNPLELLLRGNIARGNVCVAGDALHPMTPDIGQGGCAALEDGVVLARCLGKALLGKKTSDEKEEFGRIDRGLQKYAKERRFRSFDLVATAYMVGSIQQSHGKIMTFLRDKYLARFLASLLLKKADFDCGKLRNS